MIKNALLTIMLTFYGCGSSTGNGPFTLQLPLTVNNVEFNSTEKVAGKLTLFFPTGTTSQQKTFLIDAVTRQLGAFERDWGSSTIPASIFLFNKDSIP
jgi:hypothetical protein